MSKNIKKIFDATVPSAVEWASLRAVASNDTHYAARDGKFDASVHSQDLGCMVEVLHNGQFAYAASPSLEEAAVREAFDRALQLAQSAAQYKIFDFSTAVRPRVTAHWESPRSINKKITAEYLSHEACVISKRMMSSEKIIQSTASFITRDIVTQIVSTNKSCLEQTLHLVAYAMGVVARDGSIIQKRTANGERARFVQGGTEFFDAKELHRAADRVTQEALELLEAEDCPVMRGDLVLSPDQMMLQIHESVGHPLELDRILGDERNYAGSSFVQLEDIGKLQYGSKLMNISFDAELIGEAASYAFDDTGAKAKKEFLIKDGVLKRALGGLESQARSAKPGVANMRSEGWYRAPIDRMANLNLEPGTSSFDNIISSIERGVYMCSNRSWSIDDYRNKFQFGCEYAKLIENGKLTKTVRNPNYRGISSEFWRNLFKVGDKKTFGVFGTPNCGKGEPNQVIFVGHASPVCAFKDVEIFGGQA